MGIHYSHMLYTVHRVHCTVYNVHCTLYTVHCTLYIVHCTLYNIHGSVHTLIVDVIRKDNDTRILCIMDTGYLSYMYLHLVSG